MKLCECKLGVMVITEELEVGHIVGLTYNVGPRLIVGMDNQELLARTIPIVKFPLDQRSIHPNNIKIFKCQGYE